MIRSFSDKDTRALHQGVRVKRFGGFAEQARRRLRYLDMASNTGDLAAMHSNRFEKLHGDRTGQCSIRINSQWRICFRWTGEGPVDVEIVDYH